MKVLILGNGFDIHHCLPTTYYCFLKVTDYLVFGKKTGTYRMMRIESKNIGQIFSDVGKDCELINKSYFEYKEECDSLSMSNEEYLKIIDLCNKNPWWNYLVEKCQNDVGWIDVEREIHFVIENFKTLLNDDTYWRNSNGNLYAKPKTVVERILFFFFDFFCRKDNSRTGYDSFDDTYSTLSTVYIKSEYIIPYSFDKDKVRINKQKVLSDLFEKMRELASVLELYLKIFVERIVETRIKQKKLSNHNNAFRIFEKVISFNYTRTYEEQYKEGTTNHLHGEIDKGIVLGVNPDSDDEKGSNAELICFKKYYQRLIFDTAKDLRNTIVDMRTDNSKGFGNDIYVFGHSLDVTDGDIFAELFSLANTITIYHHSQEAKQDYIRNLVRIFGKEQLDRLLYDKKLDFKTTDCFSAKDLQN